MKSQANGSPRTTEQERTQKLIDAVLEVLTVRIPRSPDVEGAMLRLGIGPDQIDDQLSHLGAAISERIWLSGVVDDGCEEVFGETP